MDDKVWQKHDDTHHSVETLKGRLYTLEKDILKFENENQERDSLSEHNSTDHLDWS